MAYRALTKNVKTGEETVIEYTDAEAIALGLMLSPADRAAEIEAEVQEIADQLLQKSNDRDKAIALANVDLAIAAGNGQLADKTKTQVRGFYRDRIIEYLRADRQ